MTIKYALLGLLAHTPRHGYEMKQEFERIFSQMREVSAGQIYALMTRLTSEGKVSCETVEQKNSPPRKVYSLTEKGMDLCRLIEGVADWARKWSMFNEECWDDVEMETTRLNDCGSYEGVSSRTP